MKNKNSTRIVSVKLINSDTGKESTLIEKEGSRCHFLEVFHFQNYLIQLRLDWGDVINGDPMLDADILTENTCKKNWLRKGSWHHTKKELDEKTGKKMYTFKFQNLILRLILKMTKEITIKSDSIFVRYDSEAQKLLDELNEKDRELVSQRAIKLSIEQKRAYDVKLKDVLKAKDELLKNKQVRP